MTWHPILTDADPADAWFAERELARIRRAEAIDGAIERRDALEDAVRHLDHPTPEQIRELWLNSRRTTSETEQEDPPRRDRRRFAARHRLSVPLALLT